MRITTILNAEEQTRTTTLTAKNRFIRHCKLKNLAEPTIKYYVEDIDYFFKHVNVKYVDEITQDMFEDFIVGELEKGKKVKNRDFVGSPCLHDRV